MLFERIFIVCCGSSHFVQSIASTSQTQDAHASLCYDTALLEWFLRVCNKTVNEETCYTLQRLFLQTPTLLLHAQATVQWRARVPARPCWYIIARMRSQH